MTLNRLNKFIFGNDMNDPADRMAWWWCLALGVFFVGVVLFGAASVPA